MRTSWLLLRQLFEDCILRLHDSKIVDVTNSSMEPEGCVRPNASGPDGQSAAIGFPTVHSAPPLHGLQLDSLAL